MGTISKGQLVWAVLLLFCLPAASAAYSPWTLYDRTSGLVDNTVQVIARDADGRLWIGTRGGVSRFDGEAWQNLTTTDGLPGDDVHTVYFDPGGGVWLGTGRGFGFYRHGSWSRLGLPGAEEDERVAVVSDGRGDIWFGFGGGLMRYGGEEKKLSFVKELEGTAITALHVDGSGRLWAGTEAGLHVHDNDSWEYFAPGNGLPGGAVTAILEDRAGSVWCGTTAGLGEYDGIGWSDTGEDLPNPHVTSLAEDRQGRIWVGTMGGAGWYDGYDWIWLDDEVGIPSEEVLALGTDRNGSVWIGTTRGLARYDNSWSALEPPEEDVPSLRAPLASDGGGTVIVATEQGFFEGAGRFADYVGPAEGFQGRPTVFAFDPAGVLWIGSDKGLFSYDEGDLEHYPPPEPTREFVETAYGHAGVDVRYVDETNGLKGDMVTAVQPLGDLLWVGTTEGLSSFDGVDWDLLTEIPPLGKGEITAMAAVAEDLFVGTPEGLWRRGDEGWLALPALAGRAIGALYADGEGTLWVGSDRGLSSLSPQGWHHFGEADGFSGSGILALLRDSSGRLWVGTEAGLGLFDGSNWSTYSETDGLHANDVRAVVGRQSELFLGTGGGVSIFRPDRAPPDTRIIDPPVTVVGSASHLFEFAGSDFETEPSRMRYSWRLDDGPWADFTSQGRATLEGLVNGSHTFGVRSMDRGLNIDPTPAEVTFEVDTGIFDLELVEASLNDLYASLYQFYAGGSGGKPVAAVTVRNRFDRPLRVKFGLFIPGLMDFPSDSVAVIEPETPVKVPLRIEMNDAVLELDKTVTRQALLSMQYSLRGEMKESSHSLPVTIYQRHSMSWSDPRRIGLYVTHLDGDVAHFAREVARSFLEADKETIIYDNLLKAIEIYDALGAHGLRYVADPDNPYGGLTQNRTVLDVIRFPRETLETRTGDCDDVSVLYAALLQNIGIDTALVDVADHVFVMFDTGLRRGQEGQLSRDGDLLHTDADGKLWIPVETTLVGGTFTAAWRKGAEVLREREYAVIDIRQAWKRYLPLQLPARPVRIDVPSRQQIMPLFEHDLALQQENLVSAAAGDLLRAIDENPGDPAPRNTLGILLARNGYLLQAEAQFLEVVRLAPGAAAGHSNLGNVLYELERYDEAVESYRRSLDLENRIPGVHVELALTLCETGRFDLARRHYEKAIELGARGGQGSGVSNSAEK